MSEFGAVALVPVGVRRARINPLSAFPARLTLLFRFGGITSEHDADVLV